MIDGGHWEPANGNEHVAEFRDPEGWFKATVRADGCIDLWHYHNVPLQSRTNDEANENMELEDYLHLCDLDDLIARLQSLKARAAEHFGEWPQ